jgi:hypothetical protein
MVWFMILLTFSG